MDEASLRALIQEHFNWASKDEARASKIYAEDAVLEFPQSGEGIRGCANIIAIRSSYSAAVTFETKRITGRQDLWLNEYTIRHDGQKPHHSVGLMEFLCPLRWRSAIAGSGPKARPSSRLC